MNPFRRAIGYSHSGRSEFLIAWLLTIASTPPECLHLSFSLNSKRLTSDLLFYIVQTFYSSLPQQENDNDISLEIVKLRHPSSVLPAH